VCTGTRSGRERTPVHVGHSSTGFRVGASLPTKPRALGVSSSDDKLW
jgi:hypothetical protein